MTSKPKILIFDIETKPVKSWIWRCGPNQIINHDQVCEGERWDIICICYKWLGERSVHSLDWGLKAQNSKAMVEKFGEIVESADIVVGHNGDRFDIKQLNTQRLLHNLDPILWPTSEDTLKQFRKHFAFPSFKLDYLAKALGGAGKNPMKFQDWVDVVEHKSAKALEKMIKYCKRDVEELALVYETALKHMAPRASRALLVGRTTHCCPLCGSNNSQSRGRVALLAGMKQRRRCQNCGHGFRVKL